MKAIRHPEAVEVRNAFRAGLCEGLEVHFSLPRGTLLILCGVRDTPLWGGIIIRLTENMGRRFLGEDAYECTVFAHPRRYWDSVLKRDGYLMVWMTPSLSRMLRERLYR